MALIQTILFPVDFSPACAAAAPFVRNLAGIFGARVTLLHVIKPFDFSAFELLGRTVPEIEAEQGGLARQRLDAFLAQDLPAPSCVRKIALGEPAEEIATAARTHHFDLIVIPTYSEGAFRHALLGSTAAKVLNDADCAVLTPQHSVDRQVHAAGQRQIACAIRLDDEGARVLRYAGQLAQAAGAQLSILHVLPVRESDLTVLFDREEEQPARNAQQRISDLQRSAGTHAEVRLASGPIRQTILDAADALHPGLLVIGRSPVAGALGRMRDLTYALIRDAHCPVLSI